MKSHPLCHAQTESLRRQSQKFQESTIGTHLKFQQNETITFEDSLKSGLSYRHHKQHLIQSKAPLFDLQKATSQVRKQNTGEGLRSGCSSKSRNQSSIKSHGTNSQKRSSDRHNLKPSHSPKIMPQVSQFEQSKKQLLSQVEKKGQCPCHREENIFMTDVNRQLSVLMARMSSVQKQNRQLHDNLTQTSQDNHKKGLSVLRLEQQLNELTHTKQKWQQGKTRLEYLLNEIGSKIEQEKQSQKENMSKEDCQLYFRERAKYKTEPIKPAEHGKATKRGTLLQKLNLKVEKN